MCALQQVVPMLEPWTQQLTPCVTYDTKLTANQHSQANLQTSTYLHSYHIPQTMSRIVAHFYVCNETLCGELCIQLRCQCLPAVLCNAAHCYATTIASGHETPGEHYARQYEMTSQACKPPHQFSVVLQMVLRICP